MRTITTLLSLFVVIFLTAQTPEINVKVDRADIRIGEQTVLHVDYTVDKGKPSELLWSPLFRERVELLAPLTSDTSAVGDSKIRINESFLITSFDSGLYEVNLQLVMNGDTFAAPPVGLKVNTVEVDTLTTKLFDIKGVEAPPFVLADYYHWILIVCGLIALLFSLLYWFKRRTKRVDAVVLNLELELPPHVIALNELQRIKSGKIWQEGQDKRFYTEVTDTLRVYVEKRFGVEAMEMTSSEILYALHTQPDAKKVLTELRSLLQLSDMVKFAKFKPIESDNLNTLSWAFDVVNQTVVEPKEEEKNEQ